MPGRSAGAKEAGAEGHTSQKREYRILPACDNSATPIRLNIYAPKWRIGKAGRAGYANLDWEEADTLNIYDLFIEERYRNQGFGSALLQHVTTLARRQGVHCIVGRIVRLDIRVTPHLADWYRKQGFTVEDVSPDDPINQNLTESSTLTEAREKLKPGSTTQNDEQTVFRLVMHLTSEE